MKPITTLLAALFAATPLAAQDAPDLKRIVDALSKLKVSGYLQAQYVDDQSSRDELGGSSGTRNRDQFSVRRGRIKFVYQATSTSRFVFQPDISSSGASLRDGYVELIEPWTAWKHSLTAGQFQWPFGFEVLYSSSSREMPEFSRVVRVLFPGEYDRGVMLSGTHPNKRFSYRLAVVNGTGISRSDDLNEGKDVVARLGYAFRAVDLGASIYRGSDLVATSTNPRGETFDKERQGFDVQWRTPLPGFALRGEYIGGQEAPPSGTARGESFEVEGWYVYALQKIGTRHQLVARVDEYDPDSGSSGNAIRTFGGAYLFQWDTHSRIMVAYEVPRSERSDPDDNVFTFRYQFSF